MREGDLSFPTDMLQYLRKCHMGYGVFEVSYSVCVKIRFSGHI